MPFSSLFSIPRSISVYFLAQIIGLLTYNIINNIMSSSNATLGTANNSGVNSASNEPATQGDRTTKLLLLGFCIMVMIILLMLERRASARAALLSEIARIATQYPQLFEALIAAQQNPPQEFQLVRAASEPAIMPHELFNQRCSEYPIVKAPEAYLSDLSTDDIQKLRKSKIRKNRLLAKTYSSLRGIIYLDAACPITYECLTPEKREFVIAIQRLHRKKPPAYCLAQDKETLFKAIDSTDWHLPTIGHNDNYCITPTNTVINEITFIDNNPTCEYLETKKKECWEALKAMQPVSVKKDVENDNQYKQFKPENAYLLFQPNNAISSKEESFTQENMHYPL